MTTKAKRSHKNTARLTASERAILVIREYAGYASYVSDATVCESRPKLYEIVKRHLIAHADKTLDRKATRAKKGRP